MLKTLLSRTSREASNRQRTALFLCIAVLLSSCVSGRMSYREPDRLFKEGRYEESAEKLKSGLSEKGDSDDELLWLLDLGLVLHTAEKYEESNKYFLLADKIAEIKDYSNLATDAATLLTSDNIKQYKGEDFEKVLINAYLALNFAMMNNYESALVEARRVNRKLYRMIHEGKRKYRQNVFARYFAAVLWESQKEWDDAYIDYKKAYELMPDFPYLKEDLYRLAWITGRRNQREKWKKEFGLTAEDIKRIKRMGSRSDLGEIIVVFENGISPIKRPHPDWHSVPKFYPRYNPVSGAAVIVNGDKKADTVLIDDIESNAIAALDEKYAGIVAKKIAGAVAKEVVGEAVGKATDNPLLGFLTKVVLHASDQADIRSWNLLPKDIQIARIPVEPGQYEISLRLVGSSKVIPSKKVSISKGIKRFVGFRFMP